MEKETKKITFYFTLMIILYFIIGLIVMPIKNSVIRYLVYGIIIIFFFILFEKKTDFFKKSVEERKKILTSEYFSRRIILIGYIFSWIMFFLGIISYLLYKRVDMLITLCGFGLFFVIAIFLINKYGHKDD